MSGGQRADAKKAPHSSAPCAII